MSTSAKPKHKNPERRRSAGVLLHVTSLPAPYGVGDLGPAAFRWVDTLARAHQSWWQILPLGPPGAGHSPYQSFSAFAGNPTLISPDALMGDGLLRRADLTSANFPAAGPVDYERAGAFKAGLLAKAWERFTAGGAARPLKSAFEKFSAAQAAWLDDFALFMALKDAHGAANWTDWPIDLVRRKPAALRDARRELADAVGRHRFAQFLFFRQLDALRTYARDQGVKLIGDLPIFVSGDSADVWANSHLFQLDKHRRPRAVAGVPPDYFSETGQRWGNPLYDWRAMARDRYAWWVARARSALDQVDLVRIDHFRGFEAYWSVPADAPTAQTGRWVKAPGAELFKTLRQKLGHLPFIAEDLGVITPEVEALRDGFGLPGMRVLQFGFGGGPDNAFLPHNYVRNAVAYTGTHDNDTTAGWFASLKRKDKDHVRRLAPGVDKDPAGELLRLVWSSVADYAIAPVQDVLALGSETRMNTPGTATGNWRWRMTPEMLKGKAYDRLGQLTETYDRRAPPG